MGLFLYLGIHLGARIPKKNFHEENFKKSALIPSLSKCISIQNFQYHEGEEEHIWKLTDKAFSEILVPFIIDQYESFLYKRISSVLYPQWHKLKNMKHLRTLEQFLESGGRNELADLSIHSERRHSCYIEDNIYPVTISFDTLYFFSAGKIMLEESRGIFTYLEKMMQKAYNSMPLSRQIVIDLF